MSPRSSSRPVPKDNDFANDSSSRRGRSSTFPLSAPLADRPVGRPRKVSLITDGLQQLNEANSDANVTQHGHRSEHKKNSDVTVIGAHRVGHHTSFRSSDVSQNLRNDPVVGAVAALSSTSRGASGVGECRASLQWATSGGSFSCPAPPKLIG